MQLRCECGTVIHDGTDYLLYKATFYKDRDSDKMFDYEKGIESFFEAVANGNREKWIQAYFPLLPITHFKNDAHVIKEVVFSKMPLGNVMYQCENCGRILIQVGDENKYASFLPEDEYGHIFSN